MKMLSLHQNCSVAMPSAPPNDSSSDVGTRVTQGMGPDALGEPHSWKHPEWTMLLIVMRHARTPDLGVELLVLEVLAVGCRDSRFGSQGSGSKGLWV